MKKKICCIVSGKYRKFKNPKISHISKKHLLFILFALSVSENADEKIFKEEESIQILKVLGLIENKIRCG